jgi:hypothetical protein
LAFPGTPLQASAGERFGPSHVRVLGRVPPALKAGLVSVMGGAAAARPTAQPSANKIIIRMVGLLIIHA